MTPEERSVAIRASAAGFVPVLMIAAGVNPKALSEFLGHASISITFDLYGHLMPGAHDEAAGLLNAFLARSAGADTAATAAHPAQSRSRSDLAQNR